jgi:hypothetical protein
MSRFLNTSALVSWNVGCVASAAPGGPAST